MKTSFPAQPLIALIALLCILSMTACQKNIAMQNENAAGQSSLNIYLTDDPSLVFDKVWLDIQKLEIKVEDDAQSKHETEHQSETDDHDKNGDASGGWMNVNIKPGVYNILQFSNGLDTLLATTSFPAIHSLKKLRLTLGNKNSVVINGASLPLSLKDSDKFIVIKMNESQVRINAGGLTSFWIDVDAGRSISRHGNEYELKPGVKVFCKDVTGRLEGRVLPKDANAVVMAINGVDTSSARPEPEGEFKFTGLKSGTYSLVYHAVSGNYRDTTLNNITVKANEDSKLPAVTLHK